MLDQASLLHHLDDTTFIFFRVTVIMVAMMRFWFLGGSSLVFITKASTCPRFFPFSHTKTRMLAFQDFQLENMKHRIWIRIECYLSGSVLSYAWKCSSVGIHRITELVVLEGNTGGHLVQPFCSSRVFKSSLYPGDFSLAPERRPYNISGQALPAFS